MLMGVLRTAYSATLLVWTTFPLYANLAVSARRRRQWADKAGANLIAPPQQGAVWSKEPEKEIRNAAIEGIAELGGGTEGKKE